jgi:iron complex outermembrane receptor protein
LKFIVAALIAIPLEAISQEAELDTVVVTATKSADSTQGAPGPNKAELSAQRAATSDSARLLQDIPGVSLYGAGGVSSLPAIHGLADDRIRVQVDGMDLVAACPNHMNSALSYIDPTQVGSATVFAGITPVSVGGDSIGGTIQMKSIAPEFTKSDEQTLRKGQAGVFYRSNGQARGGNVAASLATENLHFSVSASSAKANNYTAGGDFKPAGSGAAGGPWLDGNEVGSSAYNSSNQNFGLAYKQAEHLLQLNVGKQHLAFEGFPNQRMDMTGNDSTQVNLSYTGQYQWGVLEARLYDQQTDHAMNMGPDRFSYGTLGMPMLTQARTTGLNGQGNIVLSERDILRAGIEYQQYTLNDWWPQAGGMMGPNTYWNVDFGTRDRMDVFGEWETYWNDDWLSQIGIRSDTVKADAGAVQGYNAAAIWAVDAATFNAQEHQHTDHNWDMTALARYTPDATQTLEAGFARKSHSPNLYQRYPWSTQPMAALMNNFVGDGNGYIGNVDLKPEVASTLSASGDWHDAGREQWGVKATAYYTHVQDYIDARRCDFSQCSASNVVATSGFLILQYVNQSARLYGLDLSAQKRIATSADYGSFTASGVLNYVRGENKTTGDNLYNIMPLNLKLAVVQKQDAWSNTAEMQVVAAKTQVSQVRNEIPTTGYSLFNLRSSYEWKLARLDFGIENVFNRHYALPLGGAYTGQGASMSSGSIPWGVVVPGMGRSVNAALNLRF